MSSAQAGHTPGSMAVPWSLWQGSLPFGTKEQLPGEPQLHPVLSSSSYSKVQQQLGLVGGDFGSTVAQLTVAQLPV